MLLSSEGICDEYPCVLTYTNGYHQYVLSQGVLRIQKMERTVKNVRDNKQSAAY